MSYWGLHDPNSDPLIVFSCSTKSVPEMCTVSLAGSANPVMTTVPPLPITAVADETTSSSTVPTRISAASAPWPQVSSLTLVAALAASAKAWVAPNLSAVSRFSATGSTTTTYLQPAEIAPCTALMPSPPTP